MLLARSRRFVRTLRDRRFVLVAALLLLATAALGEDEVEPSAAVQPTPIDIEAQLPELGSDVPRGALYQFLTAARAGDYAKAGEYLNLKGVAPAIRRKGAATLARQFHTVLDQTYWVDWREVSDKQTGALDDGLPRRQDRIAKIDTSKGPVDLLMEQAAWQDGKPLWKVAAATVSEVPALYSEFGYGPLAEYLPPIFFEIRFLDVQLWQWIGLLGFLAGSALLAFVLTWALIRALRPLAKRSQTHWDDRLVELTQGPVRVLLFVAFFAPLTLALGLAVPVQRFIGAGQKGLSAAAMVWLVSRLVDVVSRLIEERLVDRGQLLARSVVPLGRRAAKVILVGIAVLVVLQNFGVNVTSLIAGLGIGGLAFALAAQKSLENFFGGLTLIADRPVQVGDFCRFGDRVGTVEEVGLRSTRVRTLDRTVVSIPNSEFSNMQLENFAKRDRIWYHPTIGVRYETTPDQMRFLLVEVKRMLASHPKVDPEPARVRFTSFGAYSLDLEIFAYVRTSDFNEFLAIQEDLNLRLMDIVEASGSGFAFPSQTIYTGTDDGLSEERSRAAEETVQKWREGGDLPLPSFPDRVLSEMRSSLDYPPKGSVGAGSS